MDPIVVECPGACTVELVLSYPWQSLTAADGAHIAAAILAVWAVGFGFRALIQFVRESSQTEREES